MKTDNTRIGLALLLIAVSLLCGCGALPVINPDGKTVRLEVPFIKQEEWYCGAAAVSELSRYYGTFTTQHEVAYQLFSRKLGGILNIDLNLFLRQKGFWTQTITPKPLISIRERKQEVEKLFQRIMRAIDNGHPVIVLLGPRSRDIMGFNVRLFFGPLFYLSDYEELVRLNHFIVLTGYDEKTGAFFSHDGVNADIPIPFAVFKKRWEKVNYWALIAVPPLAINWELTAEEALDVGVMLERRGYYEDALKRYQEAAEKGKRNPQIQTQAFFNTSNVYIATGAYEQAEALLEELNQTSPDNPAVLNNLAEVYRHDPQRLDQAAHFVKEALRQDPRNAVFYLDTLAMIELARKNHSKARALLEQSLQSKMSDEIMSVLHYHMGQVLEAEGEYAAAALSYAHAAELVDEDQEPRRESKYVLAHAFISRILGRNEIARRGFQKVIALDQGEFGWQAKEALYPAPAQ